MIVAFKHEDMSDTHQGKFYENLQHFAGANFAIEVTKDGNVGIDGHLQRISYKIGTDKNDYSLEEARYNFIKSSAFKTYARAHFWTVYEIKQKLI
jgi:hypothetical protein